jgi:hypothetical protein
VSRPLHIARAEWESISRELQTRRVLAAPRPTRFETLAAKAVESIEVCEQVTRRTTVSGKWVFLR